MRQAIRLEFRTTACRSLSKAIRILATASLLIILSPPVFGATKGGLQSSEGGSKEAAKVIDRIKNVLEREKVSLKGIEYSEDKKRLTLVVSFPYDPQSSATSSYFNKLYVQIMEANGWKDFSLRDDEDKIRIDVRRKGKRDILVEYAPL